MTYSVNSEQRGYFSDGGINKSTKKSKKDKIKFQYISPKKVEKQEKKRNKSVTFLSFPHEDLPELDSLSSTREFVVLKNSKLKLKKLVFNQIEEEYDSTDSARSSRSSNSDLSSDRKSLLTPSPNSRKRKNSFINNNNNNIIDSPKIEKKKLTPKRKTSKGFSILPNLPSLSKSPREALENRPPLWNYHFPSRVENRYECDRNFEKLLKKNLIKVGVSSVSQETIVTCRNTLLCKIKKRVSKSLYKEKKILNYRHAESDGCQQDIANKIMKDLMSEPNLLQFINDQLKFLRELLIPMNDFIEDACKNKILSEEFCKRKIEEYARISEYIKRKKRSYVYENSQYNCSGPVALYLSLATNTSEFSHHTATVIKRVIDESPETGEEFINLLREWFSPDLFRRVKKKVNLYYDRFITKQIISKSTIEWLASEEVEERLNVIDYKQLIRCTYGNSLMFKQIILNNVELDTKNKNQKVFFHSLLEKMYEGAKIEDVNVEEEVNKLLEKNKSFTGEEIIYLGTNSGWAFAETKLETLFGPLYDRSPYFIIEDKERGHFLDIEVRDSFAEYSVCVNRKVSVCKQVENVIEDNDRVKLKTTKKPLVTFTISWTISYKENNLQLNRREWECSLRFSTPIRCQNVKQKEYDLILTYLRDFVEPTGKKAYRIFDY